MLCDLGSSVPVRSRSYHLQCLDPPLDDVPPGDWHCSSCVKKKIESGVYSVSEGVESIWDAREVKVQDIEGLQKVSDFVKYKGLAHFHNHWVPETQLLLEAPLLVSKFNRKNQVKWLVEYNTALASICFMILLGFVDDVLDVPWRVVNAKLGLSDFEEQEIIIAINCCSSSVDGLCWTSNYSYTKASLSLSWA
ncbi:Chromodomain-helicase-DNA-binding protein 3 [Camellia lanceoleosa]|uniref:Chromodomain-helicase-DNA-binding protein 3 n=1 Tax=Camellia lanceoleosa TaxID=1840588 RepID=A0ACC0GCR9_9ERIC|nr:Chromodomain-helicase-DNA-binding protein 3 [Camellia lanceoleosa]